MQHPYLSLKSEYETLLSQVRITRVAESTAAAQQLLKDIDVYEEAGEKSGVPAVIIAALNNRESSGKLTTYLGNGESLSRLTRLVPKGRGPFLDPDAWAKGAEDAIQLESLDKVETWDWSRALYEEESWNGFGPRNHGIHTGYLWAGTNLYTRGKYIADGKWDPTYKDQQIGTVPVMLEMIRLHPSLALSNAPLTVVTSPPLPPASAPLGVGTSIAEVMWLQETLNKLLPELRLKVDGSYGRRTRAGVRLYQQLRHLDVDGLAGPKTLKSLRLEFA